MQPLEMPYDIVICDNSNFLCVDKATLTGSTTTQAADSSGKEGVACIQAQKELHVLEPRTLTSKGHEAGNAHALAPVKGT